MDVDVDVDDDDDDDVQYALAASVAASIRRPWAAHVADPNFTRAIERQARAALLARQSRIVAHNAGACTMACQADIARFRDVRIFACGASVTYSAAKTLIDATDGGTGALLHVCIACPARLHWDAALHAIDRTNDLAAERYALVANDNVVGGLYFCRAHGRAHVCTGHDCRFTAPNVHGFQLCVLSGRTLDAPLEVAYGTGNTVISADIAHDRDTEELTRRDALALRRSVAAGPVEDILRVGSEHVRETRALGRSGEKRRRPEDGSDAGAVAPGEGLDAVAPYLDVDAPADDLFPPDECDNTFGDELAGTLARLYTQAYATVNLLLFSAERAAIEESKCRMMQQDAERRINAYVAYQRKHHDVVSLSTVRQIENRALTARRAYPTLLVPPHGIQRLTAYFAIVSVELYLQLYACAETLAPALKGVLATTADAFRTMNFASIAPTMLSVLHEGLTSNGHVLVVVEPVLAIYPESLTVDALGIPQKTCTDVNKAVSRLVVAAAQHRVSPDTLRVTQLDMTRVLSGRVSIISMFLAERRRRLAAHQHQLQ